VKDDVTILFNPADVARFNREMNRQIVLLKKTPEKVVRYGAILVGRALGASTKVSPKLRPIVKNPHPDAKTDKRRAKYGVYKYKVDGSRKFVPIYRTGEYGMTRFIDKRTSQVMVRTEDGRVAKHLFGQDDFEALGIGGEYQGIMNHPKRKIGRAGLAKSSWGWMMRKLGAGATTPQAELAGATSVETWGSQGSYTIRLTDKLRYIRSALAQGRGDVGTAMDRAASLMMKSTERALQARA
jgi:hypothetical protein